MERSLSWLMTQVNKLNVLRQMVAVSTNSDMFKSSPNQGTGNTIYERTSGKASFDSTNPNPPQLSSLCWVASMSKLFTAVSIMQLVERNLLSLEDDARDYVPELRGIQILRGMKIPSGKIIHTSSTDVLWAILTLFFRRECFSLHQPTPFGASSRQNHNSVSKWRDK